MVISRGMCICHIDTTFSPGVFRTSQCKGTNAGIRKENLLHFVTPCGACGPKARQ
jgi:hypothetical protein